MMKSAIAQTDFKFDIHRISSLAGRKIWYPQTHKPNLNPSPRHAMIASESSLGAEPGPTVFASGQKAAKGNDHGHVATATTAKRSMDALVCMRSRPPCSGRTGSVAVLLEMPLRRRGDLADGRYHRGGLPPEAGRRDSRRLMPARHALASRGTRVKRTVSSSRRRVAPNVPELPMRADGWMLVVRTVLPYTCSP